MRHGTRSMYTTGCRCFACRVANTDYEYERARGARSLATPGQTVQARRQVTRLLNAGLSKREICRLAAINRSALHNLTTAHWRTGRPVKRIAIETHEAIMSIPIGRSNRVFAAKGRIARNMGSRQLIGNAEFVAACDRLIEGGMSVAEIARKTGINRQTIDSRHSREHICAQTMARLRPLAEREGVL